MGTVDPAEIELFSRHAEGWWDRGGEFAPLHRLNPARLRYIRDQLLRHFSRDLRAVKPFEGLSLFDLGCGGGLVAEPMARLGFQVTGIDADRTALAVAQAHAAESGLAISYREVSAEEINAAGERFDVVLALECVEHAGDQALFLAAASDLVAPGGALILSTINRTAKSFALVIVGAEYLLRWLPRGTHRWEKFVRPSEAAAAIRGRGLVVREVAGLVIDPGPDGWFIGTGDVGVNYFLFAIKPK